jgi:hypothetical protein
MKHLIYAENNIQVQVQNKQSKSAQAICLHRLKV